MYLAPLNYDRYFRKVFSDTGIAKRFLEDFFDTKIDFIELLTPHHKLTDDSAAVEFDFRCRIGEQYVIIDMQQWTSRILSTVSIPITVSIPPCSWRICRSEVSISKAIKKEKQRITAS